MNTRSRAADIFFTLTFALTFYCVGAAFVEAFVNYRTWPLIGAAEFQAYHQALSPRIVGTLVIPLAVQTVMSIVLLWFRPLSIRKRTIVIAIACSLIIWASTMLIQIPIQRQLYSSGHSLELINKLISTDWIRKVFLIADALLFFWMMGRVIGAAPHTDLDVSVGVEEK